MKAWYGFLEKLEQTKGKESVDKWLRSAKIIDFDARNLYLEVADSFQLNWIKEHALVEAKKELEESLGHPVKIHFGKKEKSPPKESEEPPPFFLTLDTLDPSQTFSTYLTGKGNNLTVELLKTIELKGPCPIFLFGPSGTGKTHLLNACGHALIEKGLSVHSVHAETFTKHVVMAIQRSEMSAFRNLYRHCDALLIDDVGSLARRSATQEELFHTFNALHGSGKLILMTGDSPPSQMEEIEPRLTSRFEWGLLLSLHPPEKEEQKEIILSKARANLFPMSQELAQFLVDRFTVSTKTLLRALDALFLRHKGNEELSVERGSFLLRDLMGVEKELQITPEKIVKAVSAHFGIRPADLLGKSQARECSLPRKLAMHLCRKQLSLSYPALGRLFSRDHSTVIAGIRFVEKGLREPEIEESLSAIEKSLR